jgi:hypothetical protein
MTEPTPAEEHGREAPRGPVTSRQLGGYVLIAALILALVRFVRGARARKG